MLQRPKKKKEIGACKKEDILPRDEGIMHMTKTTISKSQLGEQSYSTVLLHVKKRRK